MVRESFNTIPTVFNQPEKVEAGIHHIKIDSYVRETLADWYGKNDIKNAHIEMEPISPKDIDFEKRMELNRSEFGKYSLNPDTMKVNWAEISPDKVKSLEFEQFVGKPMWQLIKYLMEEYPDRDKYYFPGFEYQMYLLDPKNQEKVPEFVKDKKEYYFIGSTLRDKNGTLIVPMTQMINKILDRGSPSPSIDVGKNERIIAIEK